MTKAKKILRTLKDGVFLLALFPLILVFCALSWDSELLGGHGD